MSVTAEISIHWEESDPLGIVESSQGIGMVGATGIEPVTPAMSTQWYQRNSLISQNALNHAFCFYATDVPFTFGSGGSMNQGALRNLTSVPILAPRRRSGASRVLILFT